VGTKGLRWKKPPEDKTPPEAHTESHRAVLLYEEDPLIEDGDRKERATPHDG
jgi:hypothetical protein